MTPIISNAGETRFLFGTFADVDSAPVFQGAVVYGANLTYDAETGLPNGGTVDRIDVQTRSAAVVLKTHSTYPDIHITVADLNAAYADVDTPWYDATDVLATTDQTEDAPLDLNVELNAKQMDELVSGKKALYLTTGEFFSANELSGIFAAASRNNRPKQRAKAKQKNRKNDVVVSLNATFENAATSSLNDLDIEALENELRVGTL
ncbi:hypothetical protein SAMN05444287_1146 [Octadecabacter temperatus]|jgi:hypothetical protein|uniref:Uncharacterized protein n=1 Tax=Octadecabacter temperatus TaxID=1458307 RepID=A0A0K0Y595_9RHOB|nr:hypothetical protein [Octadecabacter temperatus]AKS46041.1 hypothetical protein OSB_14890 [Octadecabacter temperatus]SIO06260.1 hypothetical protein SAMN05444287_1146 [Octadecabacter temperatus]